MNDTHENLNEGRNGGSPGMTCSPSSDTPETAALRAKLFPNTWEESYWAMKNHAEKLERERDALLCNCQTKCTTLWGGKNMDVPRCPECGKMRGQFPENVQAMASADTNTPTTPSNGQ